MKKIAVLCDERDAARAVCKELLDYCMRHGAYYELLPLTAADLPPTCTGCVIKGASPFDTVATLRGRGDAYPIVVLTRDRETCVTCYEYRNVFCAAEGDFTAILSRLIPS